MRHKILFFGIPTFILLGVTVTIFQHRKCNPIFRAYEENKSFIRNENSISEISFVKTDAPFYVNIVNETFILKDSSKIENIRKCLVNADIESYKHPDRKWEVLMKMKLVNNKEMKVKVMKMDNGGHITAYLDFCDDCALDYFTFSDSLLVEIDKILNKR